MIVCRFSTRPRPRLPNPPRLCPPGPTSPCPAGPPTGPVPIARADIRSTDKATTALPSLHHHPYQSPNTSRPRSCSWSARPLS
jgi:hypothetical protein